MEHTRGFLAAILLQVFGNIGVGKKSSILKKHNKANENMNGFL